MLPYLITYLCLGLDFKYNEACINGLHATSISINLTQNVELVQHKIETEVVKRTGTDIWIAGLTYYQMYVKETINFSFPIRPVADSLSVTISRPSQSLGVTWLF